jgi:pyruvate dehydrogenase E2 component (dihydrolipoamide acetyltransferase)
MATRIIMPKLGMAMSEGVVAKWNRRDGDPVNQGEEIAVVMSKKITYKLTAPESGVLRIVVREKETRPINTTLAFITAPGEAVPAVEQVAASAAPSASAALAAAPAAVTHAPAPAKPGFVPASPAARRLAKEKGIDLALVKGTGAEGMVTESDVTRFIEASAQAHALATSAARKLAEQRGLNLAEIAGTGIGGRIRNKMCWRLNHEP